MKKPTNLVAVAVMLALLMGSVPALATGPESPDDGTTWTHWLDAAWALLQTGIDRLFSSDEASEPVGDPTNDQPIAPTTEEPEPDGGDEMGGLIEPFG